MTSDEIASIRLMYEAPYLHSQDGRRFLAVCSDATPHLGPLFAASPELLDSLIEMVWRFYPSHGAGLTPAQAQACDKARAAVAKACPTLAT